MPQVIGVRFRDSAKVYYFSPEGAGDLAGRDYVIVETARGQEAGIVAFPPREVAEEEIPGQTERDSEAGYGCGPDRDGAIPAARSELWCAAGIR